MGLYYIKCLGIRKSNPYGLTLLCLRQKDKEMFKLKITWLGQAGLLFEADDTAILVDPYLSDSCAKINPKSRRRVPVDEAYLKIKPRVIVLTHNHLDHTDPDTLKHFINDNSNVLVLASKGAWETVRAFGGNNNYVMFTRSTVWTYNNIKFTAVKAVHSDPDAIGVIIDDGTGKFYITGDTLYNEEIFGDIPKGIHSVFLPINGAGNNMNAADAAAFAKRVNALRSVPVHFGMFDDINPEIFEADNRVIPQIYKSIEL